MNISSLLNSTGPLLGKDLLEKSGKDSFSIWKYCMFSPEVITETVGQRYLRLDRNVDGYARLSPSIMREFYGYTIIGTIHQAAAMHVMAENLHNQIKKISKDKFNLAKDTIIKSVESKNLSGEFFSFACAIVAGDIVYNMSHNEPRPEYSTGEMVRGSDLDLLIIGNNMDTKTIELLDDTIYTEKYMLLKNPGYQEELDYLIKDIKKVEQQMAFDTFESMVACKILNESQFLYGNDLLFQKIKSMLSTHHIPEKLYNLEQKAIVHRKEAEIRLLNDPGLLTTNEMTQLFFTTEEKEEFF